MVGKVTSQSSLDGTSAALPFSDRPAEDAPGHWLLASLGKKVLRPGGQYAIHELALVPDDIAEPVSTDLRRALARSIKVNARPLTVAEWTALLADAGFEVDAVYTADMALLEFRRLIADEGVLGTLRIAVNYLRRPDARRRVNGMWLTFHRHRHSLAAVAIVARKPAV
jgi:hypothetical protein